MIKVPIQILANQEITFQYNDDIYIINLKTTTNGIIGKITLNEVVLISGILIVPYTKILPYTYGNNFVFNTKDGDILDYAQFNNTQELFFLIDGIDL